MPDSDLSKALEELKQRLSTDPDCTFMELKIGRRWIDETASLCVAHAAKEGEKIKRSAEAYHKGYFRGSRREIAFQAAEIADLRADFTAKCQESYGLRNEMTAQAARIAEFHEIARLLIARADANPNDWLLDVRHEVALARAALKEKT